MRATCPAGRVRRGPAPGGARGPALGGLGPPPRGARGRAGPGPGPGQRGPPGGVRCGNHEGPAGAGGEEGEEGREGQEGQDPPRYSRPVEVAVSLLRFYKKAISPLIPPSCRYQPTCSMYAIAAYQEFGFWKGSALTAFRLLRCQPWGGRGYDPPQWPPVWR